MNILVKVFGVYFLFSTFILGSSTSTETEQLEPKALFKKRCFKKNLLTKYFFC